MFQYRRKGSTNLDETCIKAFQTGTTRAKLQMELVPNII